MDHDAVKSTMFNKLVIKVNAIDTKAPSTTELVTKVQYDSEKQALEKSIKDVDYNTKITEIKNKIPSVTELVTTTILNTRFTWIEN